MVIPQARRNYYFSSSLNGEITELASASMAQVLPSHSSTKSSHLTRLVKTKKNPVTGHIISWKKFFSD
jgi:hypothetical protein